MVTRKQSLYLVISFFLIVAGYAFFWFYIACQVREHIIQTIKHDADKYNIDFACGKINISGFPFKIKINIHGVNFNSSLTKHDRGFIFQSKSVLSIQQTLFSKNVIVNFKPQTTYSKNINYEIFRIVAFRGNQEDEYKFYYDNDKSFINFKSKGIITDLNQLINNITFFDLKLKNLKVKLNNQILAKVAKLYFTNSDLKNNNKFIKSSYFSISKGYINQDFYKLHNIDNLAHPLILMFLGKKYFDISSSFKWLIDYNGESYKIRLQFDHFNQKSDLDTFVINGDASLSKVAKKILLFGNIKIDFMPKYNWYNFYSKNFVNIIANMSDYSNNHIRTFIPKLSPDEDSYQFFTDFIFAKQAQKIDLQINKLFIANKSYNFNFSDVKYLQQNGNYLVGEFHLKGYNNFINNLRNYSIRNQYWLKNLMPDYNINFDMFNHKMGVIGCHINNKNKLTNDSIFVLFLKQNNNLLLNGIKSDTISQLINEFFLGGDVN